MRVLIAEDEEGLARSLKYLLEKQMFAVDVVHNGKDALDCLHGGHYDAVVLDIMMPVLDGLSVLRQIRAEHSAVPVMLLTAKSEISDRITGLDSGADDYLPKPFATGEFIARVRALTRRSTESFKSSTLRLGTTELDRSRYELCCGEKRIKLNNKEFQLLELFMTHPHMVFSTERLMDRVWDMDSDAGIDVVWTYIGFIRKKLKQADADIEIRTVRGAGYALEETTC